MPLEVKDQVIDGSPNQPSHSGSVQAHSIQLKLPQFWANSPLTWFVAAEAQFTISRITSESSRYYYVLAALPQDIIESVLDFIQNPPETNLYVGIKKLLIQRHSLSEEQRIEKLLSSERLGDRRPSEFYRSLKLLAGVSGSISDTLIRSLWLKRLPQVINIALISLGDKDITEVMDLADKIHEATQNSQVSAVASTSSNTLHLENEILELKKIVSQMALKDRSRSHSRSSSSDHSFRPRVSFRSNSSQRSPSRTNNKLCWYHFRYGNNAVKCCKPCGFISQDKSNSNSKN